MGTIISVILIVGLSGIIAFLTFNRKENLEEVESALISTNLQNEIIQQTYVPESTVVNQWTDQAGHTWRSMSDGSTLWWNGTDWEKNS